MTHPEPVGGFENWTVEEVRVRLAARPGEGTIIDVRTPGEHRMGHIPGAVLLPLQTIPHHVDDVRAMPRPLFIHCEHGVRSMQAAQFLAHAGVGGIVNMREGFAAWTGEVETG